MLTLLVGTPGSGKTLFAIENIIKIANSEATEFKNIENVYINISGFNFDKFKDNKVKFNKLIFDSLYVHLKILYSLFIQNENKDNLDEILQNYCKENNILNSYFIIDEAHNFFDNQDKVKSWWFTYHRHLNHEILLITQNKTLINPMYRNIPEIFVKAQPRSKAISKNVLRYFHYTEYRMTQKFSTTEITINQTYFDLYTSGNTSNQKQVGLKFIVSFIVALVFLISILGYFIYKFVFSNIYPENIEQSSNPQTQNITKNEIFSTNQSLEVPQIQQPLVSNDLPKQENLKLYKFNCFEQFCYYKIDKSNNFEIPLNILREYLLDIDINKQFSELKNNRLFIYVLVDENKFNFIKEVRNEENSNNMLPITGFNK